jgi:hypothetical protein
MGFQQYKAVLVVVVIVSALFAASPVIQNFLVVPQTDFLTELYLFGQYHNTTYPSNVTVGENYRLYLDVVNHLGLDSNYAIEVKFRNQTQSAPDSFNHTGSDLPSLGNFTFSVAKNQTFELPIDVSFQYAINDKVPSQLDIQNIIINNVSTNVDKAGIAWDDQKKGFYGNIFFELWIFNSTAQAYQYNQRYLGLWLTFYT